MGKRLIEEEKEARACIQAAQVAGKTLSAWGREQGIDGRSLRFWPAKLGLAGMGERKPSRGAELVELVPKEGAFGNSRYALVLEGIRFEFGEDVSASMLQRVVGALRSC